MNGSQDMKSSPIVSFDSDTAQGLAQLDVFQPTVIVNDIYRFTESETSHELPDKEAAKLYYANRPSLMTETDAYQPVVIVKDIYHFPESEASRQLPDKEAAKLYYAKRLFNKKQIENESIGTKIDSFSNDNDRIEETTNDEGIEVLDLDDEESTPKIDPTPKRTSKNNSKNISSDADSLLDQFDNLMENIFQNQTMKALSRRIPTEHGQNIKGQKGNGEIERSPTENGQINNNQTMNGQIQRCPTVHNGQEIKEKTRSGQKRNFQFQSNESNKTQNDKSKTSKLSTMDKHTLKNAEDTDSDIEEIPLAHDDEDDLHLNDKILSNLGKKRCLKNNSVIENESQKLVDEKTNEDFNSNRTKKRATKQLTFPDCQLNEDYGSIDLSSEDFNEKVDSEDYNNKEFRKPVFKVKKTKERSFRNVQITPRTSKVEAKFAKSKITSTPIGGIEVPISKKISLQPILLESSDDETEEVTPCKKDGNIKVNSYWLLRTIYYVEYSVNFLFKLSNGHLSANWQMKIMPDFSIPASTCICKKAFFLFLMYRLARGKFGKYF